MNQLRHFAFVCAALMMALCCVIAGSQAAEPAPAQVNFGKTDNVLDLKPFLSPYRAPTTTLASPVASASQPSRRSPSLR